MPMKNFTRTAQLLEFTKILELLADCTHTTGGRVLALNLTAETYSYAVRESLAETACARKMAEHLGTPSFWSVQNIISPLNRADRGAVLTTRELLDIANAIRCAKGLRDYRRAGVDANSLDGYFDGLVIHASLQNAINIAILEEDLIADEASEALGTIRRNIRQKNNKIKEILSKYITSATHRDHLQEAIITIRNGRHVVPVKAEHKNEIRGLVHDTSSTGATLFIEPMAVVEANNELRELVLAEEREIERILMLLSAASAEVKDELIANYKTIIHLDFVFAKAELAHRMKAHSPTITEKRKVVLDKARHPLIPHEKVVPIDFVLGDDFDAMVITGPNTGGKTVTLRTLGLMIFMAQSGLQIPCAETSSLCIFDEVFADIGDEQSVSQSLSTFSGHMTNIVGILRDMTANSLVLFDELGAGTDPQEGAALAAAILQATKNAGALCAATSHYAELKSFALLTDRFTNASCEFDIVKLAPTYRLIIGSVGRSNAFAISRRLGLGEDILQRAESFISSDSKQMEQVIDRLESSRIEAESVRESEQHSRDEFEAYRRAAEEDIRRRIAESEAALDKAREKAATILNTARITGDSILAELDAVRKKKEKENFLQELEKSRRNVTLKLDKAGKETNPIRTRSNENYVLPRPLVSGDRVNIVSLGQEGTLSSDPDKSGQVWVASGIITTRVKVTDLRLIEEDSKPAAKTTINSTSRVSTATFSPEIDLRGMSGEDAWHEVDLYLDDAVIVKMKNVNLIHGKGSGILRRIIWERLKRDGRVESYRQGEYGEGDAGVTVVTLK